MRYQDGKIQHADSSHSMKGNRAGVGVVDDVAGQKECRGW
jgi:hypothetical protein